MAARDTIDLDIIEGFNWDVGNLDKNRFKHNVEPKECEEIFFQKPLIITEDFKHSATEKRFQALGITKKGRKITIAFTIRDLKIRVISARAQSRKERREYEKVKTNTKI